MTTESEDVALALSTDAGYPPDPEDQTIGEQCAELQRRMELRKRATPICYVAILPRLIEVAKANGYALCVHGSLVRDLDLAAVPWTAEARPLEDLVIAIAECCGGILSRNQATQKPHGRIAFTIHTGAEMYLDLSVMPLVP